MTPEALIRYSCDRLRDAFGLSPVVGAELECYVVLHDTSAEGMDGFWKPVADEAKARAISLLRIEKERGHHQYELVLGTYDNPLALADAAEHLRAFILDRAQSLGIEASFSPKPYNDAPASGMHIHLHLKEASGDNAFLKSDDYISPVLHHSLGGLCALTSHVMPILCPNPTGFARFNDADHMARNVSWGSNNRSCAIRIPYSPIMDDKRLEWRVPCADARVDEVLALMLFGVLSGIEQRIEPPEQYHGVATRDASLAALPLSMDEAMVAMRGLPTIFAPLTTLLLEDWCSLRLAA